MNRISDRIFQVTYYVLTENRIIIYSRQCYLLNNLFSVTKVEIIFRFLPFFLYSEIISYPKCKFTYDIDLQPVILLNQLVPCLEGKGSPRKGNKGLIVYIDGSIVTMSSTREDRAHRISTVELPNFFLSCFLLFLFLFSPFLPPSFPTPGYASHRLW